MVQQLTIKLSIEPDSYLASIDTDYGIYLFSGQDVMAIAFFVEHYLDTNLDLSHNNTMGFTNKNNRLVDQLLADAKSLLQDTYSENEFRETFDVIKEAKLKGHLGANKPADKCLQESVNIANDILRNRNLDEIDLSTITRQPKAIYVYVALVGVGLISA